MLINFYSLFQIYETLGKANIPYLQVPGLEECFKQYECPFLNLETLYQQLHYYKNNFNLIVSTYHCL